MEFNSRQDKIFLLRTAVEVAKQLKINASLGRLRIRQPSAVSERNTDGWEAIIGRLKKNGIILSIWLDRFAGADHRKFYVCFCSRKKLAMQRFLKRLPKQLRPYRYISYKDLAEGKIVKLAEKFSRHDFRKPIFESYPTDWHFYGYYDQTFRDKATVPNKYFCNYAVAFYEEISSIFAKFRSNDAVVEEYKHIENRKKVISHLLRERSRTLTTNRKILDKYKCQVCRMNFEKVYGKIGEDFAEAHHILPLGKLKRETITSLDDLRTVCANCHRMLHRMEGTRGDIKRLKRRLRLHLFK